MQRVHINYTERREEGGGGGAEMSLPRPPNLSSLHQGSEACQMNFLLIFYSMTHAHPARVG